MSGIRKMATAVLAVLLILPAASGSAEKKKSKADVANEKAMADAQADLDRAFDAWRQTAQWRTVTQEDLALTSEPRAPGASAIYLYTESEHNNFQKGEMDYRQIKILTEEGRSLADISINYDERNEKIRRIDARVIQPDGTIVPFNGEIHDHPLVSTDQLSWRVKSFALPDVRVGSVIEVRYWRIFQPGQLVWNISASSNGVDMLIHLMRTQSTERPPRWMLNQQLFTRQARYSLQLRDRQFVRWSLPKILPPGASHPHAEANNLVKMEAHGMPAFVTEDFMPPAEDFVLSVDFSYDRLEAGDASNPTEYWKTYGRNNSVAIEYFLGNPKFVRRHLDRIVAKSDSTEQKFRKIYDHVRRMGNTDVPGSMDETTRIRCSRSHEHAWDVATEKCSDTAELQMYFIALCRSAGLPAVPVRVSSRQQRFFTPQIPDASRLDDWLVAITLDGREMLLKPGVSFLPFGAIDWWDTGVPGFRPDANGGIWTTTTMPVPADAVTRRKAKLVLSESGVLEGTVVVRHSGHEAITRVLASLQADEQTRIDSLKEDLRAALAVPADITVLRQPDWRTTDGVLEIEYQIKVQQWAVASGNLLMVGIGIFGGEQAGKFVATQRVHPMYFKYPFIAEDEIGITLPAGYKLQSAPARQDSPDAALKYATSVESGAGTISIRRSLTHNLLLTRQSEYPRVKGFYELIRSGDQEQVVLAR